MTSLESAVARFFKKYVSAGIVLPDGWYGRPGDSFFELRDVRADAASFLLELEGGRELGASRAVVEKDRFDGRPALRLRFPSGFRWAPHDGASTEATYGPDAQILLVAWR